MNKLVAFLSLFSLAGCNSRITSADCIDQSKINPEMICYEVYKPVCGCDGKTYGNDCVAQRNGVTSFTEGECGKK